MAQGVVAAEFVVNFQASEVAESEEEIGDTFCSFLRWTTMFLVRMLWRGCFADRRETGIHDPEFDHSKAIHNPSLDFSRCEGWCSIRSFTVQLLAFFSERCGGASALFPSGRLRSLVAL